MLPAGEAWLPCSMSELWMCGLSLSSAAVMVAVVVSGRLGTCGFPEVAPDGVRAVAAVRVPVLCLMAWLSLWLCACVLGWSGCLASLVALVVV